LETWRHSSIELNQVVFIISVNVEIKDEDEFKTTDSRIKAKLKKDSEVKNRIRNATFDEELNKDNYYSIIRNVIQLEIEEILDNRNKVEARPKYSYKQIFNFLYHDGQAMLTIGGILHSDEDKEKINAMAFENLEYFKENDEYFEIVVPHLTNREIQALDKYLPLFHSDPKVKEEALTALKNIISESAIEKYAKVYRYFPIYKEIAI
jgi:hypothetical protein